MTYPRARERSIRASMLAICPVPEFEFGKAIVGVIDSPGAAPDLALNWLFFGVPFENATNRSNRGRDSHRASIDRFRFGRRLICRILRNLLCNLSPHVFRKLLQDLICYLLNLTASPSPQAPPQHPPRYSP